MGIRDWLFGKKPKTTATPRSKDDLEKSIMSQVEGRRPRAPKPNQPLPPVKRAQGADRARNIVGDWLKEKD